MTDIIRSLENYGETHLEYFNYNIYSRYNKLSFRLMTYPNNNFQEDRSKKDNQKRCNQTSIH